MSDTPIDTGSEQLDADLRFLFRIRSDEQTLADVKTALADDSTTSQELCRFLPSSVCGLLTTLRTPSRYEWLLDKVSDNARHHIEDAKCFADDELADLFKHPAFLEATLGRKTPEAEKETPDSHTLGSILRSISGMQHIPTWLGPWPRFRPAVRVIFYDDTKEPLLDTTADWDTLLFASSGLLEILADQLKNGQDMVRQIDHEASDKSEMANRISELETALTRIKELAPIYGIEIQSDSSPEDR